jgi:hypothetical protein
MTIRFQNFEEVSLFAGADDNFGFRERGQRDSSIERTIPLSIPANTN